MRPIYSRKCRYFIFAYSGIPCIIYLCSFVIKKLDGDVLEFVSTCDQKYRKVSSNWQKHNLFMFLNFKSLYERVERRWIGNIDFNFSLEICSAFYIRLKELLSFWGWQSNYNSCIIIISFSCSISWLLILQTKPVLAPPFSEQQIYTIMPYTEQSNPIE